MKTKEDHEKDKEEALKKFSEKYRGKIEQFQTDHPLRALPIMYDPDKNTFRWLSRAERRKFKRFLRVEEKTIEPEKDNALKNWEPLVV